jgi:hypothetical protein
MNHDDREDDREELALQVLELRREADVSPTRRARLLLWADRIAAELSQSQPPRETP